MRKIAVRCSLVALSIVLGADWAAAQDSGRAEPLIAENSGQRHQSVVRMLERHGFEIRYAPSDRFPGKLQLQAEVPAASFVRNSLAGKPVIDVIGVYTVDPWDEPYTAPDQPSADDVLDLAELQAFPRLRGLDISRVDLDESNMHFVTSLVQLECLWVRHTTTDERLDKIQYALPRCEVIRLASEPLFQMLKY